MKAKLDFKSKRTIIIAGIIAVLTVGAGVGGYFYGKGNNQSGAANIDNQTSQNSSQDNGKTTPSSDNKKDDKKPDTNPDNGNADNNGEGNGNADNGNTPDNGNNNDNAANNGGTDNGNNANNGGTNNGNATNNGGNGNAADNGAQDAGDDTDATTVIETVTEENPWESHSVEWTPEALKVSTSKVDTNIPQLQSEKIAYVQGEEIDGTPDNTAVQNGEEITYVIKVKNTGDTDASKVMIYDTVPEGTVLKENAEGTVQTIKDADGKEIQRIVWEKDVKAGETIEVSFKVTVNIEEVEGEEIESITLIENKATVNRKETNKTENPVITSNKVASLVVDEEATPITNEDFVKPGQTIRYTISVMNTSKVKEAITTISDTVPEGTTLVENSIDKKVVNVETNAEGKITLEWKNITVNTDKPTSVSFDVTVNEDAPAKIRNVATVGDTDTPPTENEVYIDVTVQKVWDDAENQDGKRPESLDVELSNGDKVTLNEENGWKATIKNLPKYVNGEEFAYTWKEATLPTGYTLTDTSKSGRITTLTNTHIPEKIDVTVNKVWDDAENQDGKRPDSLTVQLKANGQNSGDAVTLNAGNEWTTKVENLPKFANGKEIAYTWTELDLPKEYELTNTNKVGNVTTLTNTHVPETTKVTIKKVWDDANNQDGKRPSSLTVKLNNDLELTLNAGNEWTAKVENLPKFANGTEIEYTWTEGSMPQGYTLTDTSVNGTTTTLTNSHTPEKTEATVKKVWDDANNQDGKRPASLTVQLKANGQNSGDAVTLNAGNEWTAKVENLPKFANGQEIVYTWTEGTMPTGYTLTDTSKNGTVTTLTNTRQIEKTSVTATKVWEDKNNKFKARPDSVTVQLKANGQNSGNAVTLNAGNNWTYTWENLDVNTSGNKITYTVVETTVPTNYTAEVTESADKGFTITNTYDWTSIKHKIPVTKIWHDTFNNKPNAYNARHDIEIIIKAKNLTITKDDDGNDVYTVTDVTPATYTEVKRVTLKASDLVSGTDSTWSKEVEVRKYDDEGTEIEYSIEEVKDEEDKKNFTTTTSGNTVENAFNNVTIIEERKGEILDLTYETRLDTVIVLDISGSMDKGGERIKGTGWLYAKPVPIIATYEWGGTHTVEFTNRRNPPRGIDRDLIEYSNGYWCFKEGVEARTVEYDVLSQTCEVSLDDSDHTGDANYKKETDADYTTRIRSAVKAVNESIHAVLYKEDGTRTNSRVALVVYSSKETENQYNHFDSATMIPLGEYTPNENGEYIHLQQNSGDSNDVISVVAKTKNGGNITGNTSSAKVAGGTYTQAGIKQGGDILTSNPNKTYTSNNKTMTYVPVMILVTDGEPTYYNDEPNVSDNQRNGEGNYNDQTYDEHTIETAAFYKAKVSDSYKTECQIYTIGYGLSGNDRATDMLNPGSSTRSSVLYSGKQYKNIKFDVTENSKTYHCVYDYANGASVTGNAETEAIIAAMKDVVEHIQKYIPNERRVSSLGNVKSAELTDLDRNQNIIIDLTDAAGHETLNTYTYEELRTLGAITGDTVDFTNSLFNGAKYIMIDYKSTANAGAKSTRFIKSSKTFKTIDMDPITIELTDEQIEEIEKTLAGEDTEKEEENKQETENNNIEENKEVENTEKENVVEENKEKEDNKEKESNKEKEENKDNKENNVVEEEKESNSDKEETEKEKVEEKEETKKEDNKEKENKEKEESKEEKASETEKTEKTEKTSTKTSTNEQEKTEKVEQETIKPEVTEENNN